MARKSSIMERATAERQSSPIEDINRAAIERRASLNKNTNNVNPNVSQHYRNAEYGDLGDFQQYIQEAMDWAIKMSGPVKDGEYSSKWHAAESKTYSQEAAKQASNAAGSAIDSATSAEEAKTSAIDSAHSAQDSFDYSQESKNYSQTASEASTNAAISEAKAKASELAAKDSETKAALSESNASESETNAGNYSASASQSKDAAADSAKLAHDYTVGPNPPGSLETPTDTNNAYYYYKQAMSIVTGSPIYSGEFKPTPSAEYPTTDPTTSELWIIVTDDENGYTFTGGDHAGETALTGDWFIFNALTDTLDFLKVSPLRYNVVHQATESIQGIARIATQPEVDAGADDLTFVTPKKLTDHIETLNAVDFNAVPFEIIKDVNLDDNVDPGLYIIGANVIGGPSGNVAPGASMFSSPLVSGLRAKSTRDASVGMQILWLPDLVDMFMRVKVAGAWSGWVTFYTDSRKPTPGDIGARDGYKWPVVDQDWDNLTEGGIYHVNNFSGPNGPSTASEPNVYKWGILVVTRTSKTSGNLIQEYTTHQYSKVYRRWLWGNAWTPWFSYSVDAYSKEEVPTFDEVGLEKGEPYQATGATIASPAGTFDLNTLDKGGIFNQLISYQSSNLPTGGTNGYVENFTFGTSGNLTQFFIPYGSASRSGKISYRTRFSDVWEDWSDFYTTANKPTAADVDTYTKAEIDALIAKSGGESFKVGALYLSLTSENPADSLGYGTWELLDADSTLIFGSGVDYDGSSSGTNQVEVPVAAHTHGASFVGNKLPNHGHTVPLYKDGGTDRGISTYRSKNKFKDVATTSVSAGTPSGTVTVESAGTAGATIDVRGKRVFVNVWRRTA